MTIYVDPPEDATENVKNVCEAIKHILSTGHDDNIDNMHNTLKERLRQLSPAEKEQLKQACISQNKNTTRTAIPGVNDTRADDFTPYPYPETKIGQVNPLSPPFDNEGWDTLLNILKEHQII